MSKKKFLIVGAGGRESAFALRLIEDSILFAVINHKNPTIIDCTEKSGGKYLVANSSDPVIVTDFAKQNDIDYVFVSADDPLANGVVDELLKNDIKAIGGTKEATRIEWDKIYSINMVSEVCPEFTPFYQIVTKIDNIQASLDEFEKRKLEVVVKPQGLTGGKGVKVMPEHLSSYSDCYDYAKELLQSKPNEKVLLVEKLEGIEFTIMGITDGENLVLAPASYDYPFRYENDKGPGTGGMGCFTSKGKNLPFMNDKDLSDCQLIMQRIINKMKDKDLFFNGVLNGGFFKTSKGIKFMEFNSRFGDPEGLNILTILDCSFAKLLEDIWNKKLADENIKFIEKASVIKYLVAKEYPKASNDEILFDVDVEAIENMGVKIFFSAAEQVENHKYTTLKKSRVIALGAVASEVSSASQLVNQAIDKYITGNLEYRKDIGENINAITL